MSNASERVRAGAAAIVTAWLALGCQGNAGTLDDGEDSSTAAADSGSGHELPVDMVRPETWVWDPTLDPLPMHAPAEVDCAIGFKDEFGVFEVDTGLCNYGVFSQLTAVDIGPGDLVESVFTHDDLVAPEPAQGHIALAIGGRIIYEAYVDIPQPYGLLEGQWYPDVLIPAGTPVVFHVHNHGYNSWRVVSIKAKTP